MFKKIDQLTRKFNSNKKQKKGLGKYILIGSFSFFLIKGLVWLLIFIAAGLSLIKVG